MRTKHIFSLLAAACWLGAALAGQTQAQGGGQNPTPIVISLTPPSLPTPTPSPTVEGTLPPDRFEPNDEAGAAASLGWQVEPGLTLTEADQDYFRLYLKAGQMGRISTTVYGLLDTRLQVYGAGQLVAENDDRSPADVGSTVVFAAAAEGWYIILVEKVTVYAGEYDLETALAEPTPTYTPSPTLTATPTLTPTPSPTPLIAADGAEPNDTPATAWPIIPGSGQTYTVGAGDVDYFTFIAKAGQRYACETVTSQVDTLLTLTGEAAVMGVNDDRGVGRVDSYLEWLAAAEQPVWLKVEARGGSFGPYEFSCHSAPVQPTPPMPPPAAGVGPGLSPTTVPLTNTLPLTMTGAVSLTVEHLGPVQPQATLVPTTIRLLVYYDANNDRQPGPGEGIANVSVLAVSAQGQRIARVFTNAQGEATFSLSSGAVARIIVPFVPGWSARIRAGETNNDIILGLPAVRLPIFLPVRHFPTSEE